MDPNGLRTHIVIINKPCHEESKGYAELSTLDSLKSRHWQKDRKIHVAFHDAIFVFVRTLHMCVFMFTTKYG